MGLFSAALLDPAQAAVLTGLKNTYSAAANVADAQCGSGYAVTMNGAGGMLVRGLSWWVGGAVAFVCTTLQLWP